MTGSILRRVRVYLGATPESRLTRWSPIPEGKISPAGSSLSAIQEARLLFYYRVWKELNVQALVALNSNHVIGFERRIVVRRGSLQDFHSTTRERCPSACRASVGKVVR